MSKLSFGLLLAVAAGPAFGAATGFRLTSPAFKNDEPMPPSFTADGKDLSPALAWEGVPPGAAELALIVDDPDAPQKEPWVHWVLFHVHASAVTSLPEGVPPNGVLGWPKGATQGKNSWGTLGYRGPQPPPGKWHHYRFHLYALDQAPQVPEGATKDQLLAAIKGHVLGETELVGRYRH